MKILSVIIPTYNMEKYLDRCLLSLTNNSKIINDIEIIVVNDGSIDRSLNIAKKYKKEFPKSIIIIDKENAGHGSTINEGIKVAKGKYLKVVDADDWVDINSFPSFVQDLKNVDTDAVITNYVFENVFDNSVKSIKYEKLEEKRIYRLGNYDEKDYFPIHSITYKTKLLRDNDLCLDINTFYVDMEYITYPLPYLDTFTYLDYDLYRYFIGRPDQSVSINSFIKHRIEHEKVLKNVLKTYKSEIINTDKSNYCLNIIYTLLRTHYIIYCKSKCHKKELKKEIRDFTKYLKLNYKNIYRRLLKENLFIKWNVRTNFVFSQCMGCMFSRIADKFDKRSEE